MTLPRRRAVLGFAALAAGLALTYRDVLEGQVIAGRDAFRLYFASFQFIAESLRSFELPLWNPYLRLGQPFLAAIHTQALYPPTWFSAVVFGPVAGFTFQHLLHVGIAATGAFRCVRALGRSTQAAAVAAMVFGFSPLLTDLGTQRNVVDAAAWTGWIALLALRLAQRPGLATAGRLALVAAVAFFAGSPETNLLQAFIAGLVLLAVRTRRGAAGSQAVAVEGSAPLSPDAAPALTARASERRRHPLVARALWASAAAAWTLCLGAALLLPAIELVRASSRGGANHEPLDWSTSAIQLVALFWPRADLPRGDYWGDDQWWFVTLFLGTTAFALAAAGLRRARVPLVFAGGAGVLLLLAMGKHFPPAAWLITHSPLSAFRYPAKALLGAAFLVAVLAAFGTDRLAVALRRRGLSLPGVIAVVFLAVLALAAGGWLLRTAGVRAGTLSGLPWVVVTLAVFGLALFLVPGSPRRARHLRWALAALVAFELGAYHLLNPPFGWERPVRLGQPSLLAAQLPRDFQGRISLPMRDGVEPERPPGAPSYIDHSRDALVPNRSMEEHLYALEGYGAPEPSQLDSLQHVGRRSVFDLTGVEYYVREGPAPYPDLELVHEAPWLPKLYRSKTAMPRAFVVHRAEVVDDETAIQRLWDEAQPLRTTAYLAAGEPLDAPCEGSTATLREHRPGRVIVEVEPCGEGYLVLSDAYAPGWRATVDGRSAPVLRADYGLRAVRVGARRQRVELVYAPRSFFIGAGLSSVGVLAVAAALWRGRSRKAKRPAQ